MGKKQVRELENTLIGIQGGFIQYRNGMDETFVPYGFIIGREKLEAARRDLESLDLYQLCRDALVRAEELVKAGPEHDEEAEMLILAANRTLMAASGTYAEMSRKLREKPTAMYEDFMPDPDAWEQRDREREQRRKASN